MKMFNSNQIKETKFGTAENLDIKYYVKLYFN